MNFEFEYYKKQFIKTIVVSAIVFVVVLIALSSLAGVQERYQEVLLDPLLDTRVYKADGSIETYDDSYFQPVHKGEKIVATITFDKDPKISDGALSFVLYHSNVRVFVGNHVVYEDNMSEQTKLIGGRTYMISLPQGYQNHPIRIEATIGDAATLSSINGVKLVSSIDSIYAFESGHIFSMLTFTTVFIFSVFISCYFLIRSFLHKHVETGLYLALFSLLLTTWYMSYKKFFAVFSNQVGMIAYLEYISLFLVAIPLALYMRESFTNRKYRIGMHGFAMIFLVFFLAVTGITFSPLEFSYVNYQPYFHCLLFAFMLYTVYALFKERKIGVQPILLRGVFYTVVIGVLELLRFNAMEHFGYKFSWLRTELIPVGLLMFLLTLYISFALKIANDYKEKMQALSLSKIAYVDSLTGCPNRASCYEKMRDLEQRGIQDYVLVFVDINYLKKTNDLYGHHAGDALLIKTAELMDTYFHEGYDFYGRWGGDEFIACLTGDEEKNMSRIIAFREAVSSIPVDEKFPLGMSISLGISTSTKEHPVKMHDAISIADDNMYEDKKVQHALRSA